MSRSKPSAAGGVELAGYSPLGKCDEANGTGSAQELVGTFKLGDEQPLEQESWETRLSLLIQEWTCIRDADAADNRCSEPPPKEVTTIEQVKAYCKEKQFGGFTIHKGYAYLLKLPTGVHLTKTKSQKTSMGSTLYVLRTARQPGMHRPAGEFLQVSWMYVCAKTGFFTEVWLQIFIFYYMDVGLDMRMLFSFFQYSDYKFMAVSISGIGLGVVFTLFEMESWLRTNTQDPHWMIMMCGFLLPFQLHVAFLCVYSTACGVVHPLIYSFKLAECFIEGSISSLIQTYALIFRDLPDADRHVGYVSACVSMVSIAFALTQFDNSHRGLAGLPGVSEGWTPSLVLVFFFRFCEVLSRIVSICLFQLVMRNEEVYNHMGFGSAGGAAIIVFDILIMFLLTVRYQGMNMRNWIYCTISFVAFINPMLLTDNAFTMPAWVYYSVRLVELVLMGVAAWHFEVFHGGRSSTERGHGLEVKDHHESNNLVHLGGFNAEFIDDFPAVYAFLAATVCVGVLLPLIRCCLTKHVLLMNKRMYSSHRFSKTEERLCNELIDASGPATGVRDIQYNTSGTTSQSLVFKQICEGLVDNAMEKLRATVELCENSGRGRADKEQSGELLERDTDSQSPRAPQAPKARRASRAGSALLGGDEESGKMVPLSATSQPDTFDHSSEDGCCTKRLDEWLFVEFKRAKSIRRVSASVETLFVELVRVGNNLHNFLKCDSRFEGFLALLNRALDLTTDAGARTSLEDHAFCKMLLRQIPQWQKVDLEDTDRLEQELLLFQEKCNLIAEVMQAGWGQGRTFIDLARQFHIKFDARTSKEIDGFIKDIEGGIDAFDYVVRLQTYALVAMFRSIPVDLRDTPELMCNPHDVPDQDVPQGKKGLFRKNFEVQALLDGLDLVMAERGNVLVGTMKSTLCDVSPQEVLNTVVGAFDDELVLAVTRPKLRILNSALDMYITCQDSLKLHKIVKKKNGQENIETRTLEQADVVGAFHTDEEGKYTRDWDSIDFHFKRAEELEDQHFAKLSTGVAGAWTVYNTVPLTLFANMPSESLEFLCRDGRFHLPREKDPLVLKFLGHQNSVENAAKKALGRKLALMRKEVVDNVDPATARGKLQEYRQDKKSDPDDAAAAKGPGAPARHTITFYRIGTIKGITQKALGKYEDSHEGMKEYLKVVKERFHWSKVVEKEVDRVLGELVTDLKMLRSKINSYWNSEESAINKVTQSSEKQAKEAENAAKERETVAIKAAEDCEKRERDEREKRLGAMNHTERLEEKKKIAEEERDKAIDAKRQIEEDLVKEKAAFQQDLSSAQRKEALAMNLAQQAEEQVNEAQLARQDAEKRAKLAEVQGKAQLEKIAEAYRTAQAAGQQAAWLEPLLASINETKKDR